MPGYGSTVQIPPEVVRFLEKRGARSQRGHSEFSRSAVLHRSMIALRTFLADCDPQMTGKLSAEQARLAVRLLPSPWRLSAFEVEHLAALLEGQPDFAAAAAEEGVETAPFLAAVAALSRPERLALIDQAVQERAPAASAAVPEEP
jgi:hypothetical protein